MSEKKQLLKEMVFSIINCQPITIDFHELAERLGLADEKTVLNWLNHESPEAPTQAQVFAIQEMLIKHQLRIEKEQEQEQTLFIIEEIDTQFDLMLAGIESEQMPQGWHFSAGRTVKRLINDLAQLKIKL